MVNNKTRLDRIFAALSDPTRRAILARLSGGDLAVSELAAPFRISLPAVSRHLRILKKAGLLAQDRQGRIRRCRLRPAPLRQAAGWIARYRRFWNPRIESLARFLESSSQEE